MAPNRMTAAFFPSASDLRIWFEANHKSVAELRLRLRKSGAKGPGVTYPEALDLALCFGWIDGVRHSIDRDSYAVRFTPRKAGSIWSKVNLGHYKRLEGLGSVAAAGRDAFLRREPARTGLYSFESKPRRLPASYRRIFQASPNAWAFFAAQPPGYRRTATFWVLSAKQEATRSDSKQFRMHPDWRPSLRQAYFQRRS